MASSRESLPAMIEAASVRALKTVSDAFGPRGIAAIRSFGGLTSSRPVIRRSSVRYFIVF